MDTALVLKYLPDLLNGFVVTLELSAITVAASTPLALALALARDSGRPWLSWPASTYVAIFRVIPALIVLFFTFYALPQLGFSVEPLTAAAIGFVVVGAAYMCEDIRAGLTAVDPGQHRAARALGLGPARTFWRIIFPQALPLILPPYATRVIIMIKGTALASLVAVSDLTGEAVRAISITFSPYGFLAISGVLYLALSGVVALLQIALESYLARRFRLVGHAARR